MIMSYPLVYEVHHSIGKTLLWLVGIEVRTSQAQRPLTLLVGMATLITMDDTA